MLDVGFAGEFRIVISDETGNIKKDTGYQKNLILNQGLDFLGGNKGGNINSYCVIGSGNSAPTITQTHLDAAIAIATGSSTTSDYSYVDKGDNLYRMWEEKRYRFEGLQDVNISEVGLVSQGNISAYWLTTRALIKDSLGNPTAITIKAGEVLDVYYKIHKVIDTRDKTFVVNMLDGDGGSIPYNVVIRPTEVGLSDKNTVATALYQISRPTYGGDLYIDVGVAELVPFDKNQPTETVADLRGHGTVLSFSGYSGGNKRILNVNIPLGVANRSFNRIRFGGGNFPNFFPFNARFSSVDGDLPIPKTNQYTLSMAFEYSWGRFEGEL